MYTEPEKLPGECRQYTAVSLYLRWGSLSKLPRGKSERSLAQ